MRQVVCGVALLLCWTSLAYPGQHVFQGRLLEDALRVLQRAGLPLVFSSEIVTPSMRVAAEPRGTTPRRQLDQLLEPHGLKAKAGPGGVILIVREDTSRVARSTPRLPASEVRKGAADATATGDRPVAYTDSVTVLGWGRDRVDRGVSGTTLDTNALQSGTSILQGDALDAVHAMPRVTAVDDIRSEFSVRGSPYRQIGVVIDGVATRWLQHAVYGRYDAGSLSMFGGDVIDRATLQAGAYPRRHGDVLGAQLELSVKEGSRQSTRFGGIVGGTSAAFIGEGPIGDEARGSWIAGVRNSFRSWPVDRVSPNDVGFAFADAHTKLVYDVSPTQQISVTTLAGRSTVDPADEPLVSPFGEGTTEAALLNIGWQSTLGSHTVIRQRVSLVGQDLWSRAATGQLEGRNTNRALQYQGEVLHAMAGGLFEAGTEISRLSGTRDIEASAPAAWMGAYGATWANHSAYVNFARAFGRSLSFEVGGRAGDSTLVHEGAFTPWTVGAWRVNSAWTITASIGASRQFPDLEMVAGPAGSTNLTPERATHVDVGVEHHLSNGVKWQATFFNRVEHDGVRVPDLQPRLGQDGLIDPPGRYLNVLHGQSQGIDLLLARERNNGVSGWMSYTAARTQETDTSTYETFSGDFDQRHAFNAAGLLHIRERSSVGIVFRAASGIPIPGYFDLREGHLVVGGQHNTVRLPLYARLDARVQRTFSSSRHRVTLFGEVLNALNRRNEGVAIGTIQPVTFEAVGYTRTLMSRRASVGLEFDMAR
ncbi:MAG TPA: TonB-dependent receptor [Vicinamibacterales bacterium]|nr:TonB-dependent receptor [Vicinamibacterales bacterium]